MAFNLCIQRASISIDDKFVRTLFELAFNDIPIHEIFIHQRTNPYSKEKYIMIFIYFKHSNQALDNFREIIWAQGFAQLSFGESPDGFDIITDPLFDKSGVSTHNWIISE